MKRLLIALSLYAIATVALAETNYQRAIHAAKNSEGTDAAIEESMRGFGFEKDSMEEITFTDKIAAII